jgi:hypothetical protein
MLFVAAAARVCRENIAPARDTVSGDFPAFRTGIVSCWKQGALGLPALAFPPGKLKFILADVRDKLTGSETAAHNSAPAGRQMRGKQWRIVRSS